ncbi:hypothetical protein SAMN04488048_11625 [Trichococcus flocculiformis]|uniref:hypothetical protein n=1 Tax=Trichococcus TaxID=82802 RepID=UPI0007A8CB55|nr:MULTISPECIES: hypothetical protein [Trichococcus]CZR06386.1 Hypothetical protein TES5_2284 [Trichococcus sp. ES5]SHF90507.1 hypothetical protein SAMN04488048_11625 [Trichococcus flocculiformis]
MNFLKNNVISVMYLVLLSTLFMPWILVPDSETFTVLPVTGFRFLSDNLLMLILIFLIIFTYVFSLKSNGLSILILLELELIFLAALLLAPAVTQGLAFFSGVKYGYFIMLIILITLAFYNYLFIAKHIQKRENG